jgi:FXSXX-COOH protein
MSDTASQASESGDALPVIHLAEVSLADLARLDDTVLMRSLKRVMGDLTNPEPVVLAAFNACI